MEYSVSTATCIHVRLRSVSIAMVWSENNALESDPSSLSLRPACRRSTRPGYGQTQATHCSSNPSAPLRLPSRLGGRRSEILGLLQERLRLSQSPALSSVRLPTGPQCDGIKELTRECA